MQVTKAKDLTSLVFMLEAWLVSLPSPSWRAGSPLGPFETRGLGESPALHREAGSLSRAGSCWWNCCRMAWVGLQACLAFSSFGHIPWRGIPGSFDNCLTLWRSTVLFSTVTAVSYIPTSHAPGSEFLHIVANTCYYLIFFIMATVITHCGFYLHFPND